MHISTNVIEVDTATILPERPSDSDDGPPGILVSGVDDEPARDDRLHQLGD
jgi:hypothetical protein